LSELGLLEKIARPLLALTLWELFYCRNNNITLNVRQLFHAAKQTGEDHHETFWYHYRYVGVGNAAFIMRGTISLYCARGPLGSDIPQRALRCPEAKDG
jgi:hypothetical protein